jgi:methylglutaconyl-CoA hydratase
MSKKVLTNIAADGNATVLLNRPDAHNAFDSEMVDALTTAFRKLGADPKVRAVVLTGAGKSFCAGADIAHMKKSAKFSRERNLADAHAAATMLHALYSMDKPTIACIRGAVRGGGLGLVAACDIAIAERLATFRLSEVRLGIIPAVISPYVLAAVGERMARRYMLSGEEFDVGEAFRIGLIHDVCEEPELNGTIGGLLARLYACGPGAMAAAKRLIREVKGARIDAGLALTTAHRLADIRASPEAQEGLSAFLEKRKATWVEPRKSGKNKAAAKRPR